MPDALRDNGSRPAAHPPLIDRPSVVGRAFMPDAFAQVRRIAIPPKRIAPKEGTSGWSRLLRRWQRQSAFGSSARLADQGADLFAVHDPHQIAFA